MKYTVNAYAKININLRIEGKRDDGYHNLQTLMHLIPLCDRVDIELCEKGIHIKCNDENIPTDEKNIAYKAAKRYFDEIGYQGGVKINIEKNIPVASGFGGSATDGAAVLLGLNRALGALSKKNLFQIAEALSADMPFLLMGADKSMKKYVPICANCLGKGEIMTTLPSPVENYYILLTQCDKGFTSSQMYKAFDFLGMPVADATKLGETDFYNDFEPVAQYLQFDLANVKDILKDSEVCMMSGSGNGVFALFKDITKANAAKEKLSSIGKWTEIYDI